MEPSIVSHQFLVLVSELELLFGSDLACPSTPVLPWYPESPESVFGRSEAALSRWTNSISEASAQQTEFTVSFFHTKTVSRA